MTQEEVDLERLRVIAERAGLALTDVELEELAVGQQRNQAYLEALRGNVSLTTEPAFKFVVLDDTSSAGDGA